MNIFTTIKIIALLFLALRNFTPVEKQPAMQYIPMYVNVLLWQQMFGQSFQVFI